ncbi:MAG: hypothetical protein QOF92_3934 [Pseudonocardiales bacterium]|nr:hypothetical protein [Pseudonocardiales bacterium]
MAHDHVDAIGLESAQAGCCGRGKTGERGRLAREQDRHPVALGGRERAVAQHYDRAPDCPPPTGPDRSAHLTRGEPERAKLRSGQHPRLPFGDRHGALRDSQQVGPGRLTGLSDVARRHPATVGETLSGPHR